jgi:hypothetical protein
LVLGSFGKGDIIVHITAIWMRALTFAQLCAALPLLSVSAFAQTMSAAEAADAFGVRERILHASLSPDGTKVALVSPGPEQSTVVQIFDIASKEIHPISFADGKPMTLVGCNWPSNKRLLCSLHGVSNRQFNMLLPYSRQISMAPDGSDARPLIAMEITQWYAQNGDGYIIDWRDGSTDKVLMARNYVPAKGEINRIGGMAEGLGVDLIDTATGKVEHVESANVRATHYLADGQGTVRIMGMDVTMGTGTQTRGETTYSYRLPGSRTWQPFAKFSRVTEQGMRPIAVDGTANKAYVLRKFNGRFALYRVALDGSMTTELAYAHPSVDIDGVIKVGRRGRVVGAVFTEDTEQVYFFDADYAKMARNLAKALPRMPQIHVVASSADEKKHLIFAASDVQAGRYYFFNSEARSLTEIGSKRPQLDGVSLGQVQAVQYPASDGTMIPAYLTLPPNIENNIPAVVLPHGGPASRDSWGFDWLAQFFVARGFAVIQPNFRGSSGYGDEWFQENGFRS